MKNSKLSFIRLIFSKLKIVKEPEVVFLIGLPGSGKSTYLAQKVKENPKKFEKYRVCSTDTFIEYIADMKKKTYTDVFEELYPAAERNFFAMIEDAAKNNQSMFIDRTNCSVDDRKQILEKIPVHYKKRAVIFHVPHDELRKRLHSRYEATGKLIPEEALQKIINKYEHPTSHEFDVLESA